MLTEDSAVLLCVSRLPKDQDCHELWSRMMKKALRERLSRPSDDQCTAVDARSSSTKSTASMTASQNVTTATSHNGSLVYSKNVVPATVSSDLNLSGLVGPRWYCTGSQHVAAGHDKSAVHTSSYLSSIHSGDSSYLTRRPVMTRHFDSRHVTTSSPRVHAPTANNH